VDWSLPVAEHDLLEFTETLAGMRREHPVFRRRRFFRGSADEKGDIVWLTQGGEMMTDSGWGASEAKSLAVFLNGEAITEPDPRGGKVTDAKFLLLFNAHSAPRTFTLPEAGFAAGWEVVVDTDLGTAGAGAAGSVHAPKSDIEVRDRAVIVLRSVE
jgi:glycogen operon protein